VLKLGLHRDRRDHLKLLTILVIVYVTAKRFRKLPDFQVYSHMRLITPRKMAIHIYEPRKLATDRKFRFYDKVACAMMAEDDCERLFDTISGIILEYCLRISRIQFLRNGRIIGVNRINIALSY